MSRYITPLPGLLARLIEQGLTQAIALDAQAAERMKPLEGRTVRLALDGLGLDLYFIGQTGRLEVRAESDLEADTTIRGTPAALLAMAVPDWRAPGSGVRIEGDAGTAQSLEKLMRRLDPDWERLATDTFGEVVGHQVWRLTRDALQLGQSSLNLAGDQLGRYLREESGLLITREEIELFSHDVDELRESIDRLESRLRREGRA